MPKSRQGSSAGEWGINTNTMKRQQGPEVTGTQRVVLGILWRRHQLTEDSFYTLLELAIVMNTKVMSIHRTLRALADKGLAMYERRGSLGQDKQGYSLTDFGVEFSKNKLNG